MASDDEGAAAMGTDVVERGRGLDLTRAPQEQWNDEMVKVVAKNVFRGKEITEPQLYYCLSVAESLGLNPMIGEVYYLPSKSQNASGPAWTPYIGRTGLVAKATERGFYFESDTVHEKDEFRIVRGADGERSCTHSYGQGDRGEVVGAYAFLHDRSGRERPAFFYAPLDEYLPSFDQEWKMNASPWGNQRSAMMEKCAMIGAGRKRLNLGNVLMDGEVERVFQQGAISGPQVVAAEDQEFDWESLDAPGELVERLRVAVERVNGLRPLSWPPAKVEMVVSGMPVEGLERLVESIEGEAEIAAAEEPVVAQEERAGVDEGDSSSGSDGSGEGVTDAVVVEEELPPEDVVRSLSVKVAEIEDELNEPGISDERRGQLAEELAGAQRELAAAENEAQERLL